MMQFDFYAESRDYITQELSENTENRKIINNVLQSYTGSDKIEFDELVSKLLVHALLDRSGQADQIKFINEFVLGVFWGELISKSGKTDWVGTEKQAEITTTAYSILGQTERDGLWNAMNDFRILADSQYRIEIDLKLQQRPVGEFNDSTFENLIINKSDFSEAIFNQCVFIDCQFSGVAFSLSSLKGCGFLSCRFFSCSFDGDPETCSNWFEACSDDNGTIASLVNLEPPVEAGEKCDSYEKGVLERFLAPR